MADHGIPAHARNTTTTTRPDGPLLDAFERRRRAYERLDQIDKSPIGKIGAREQALLSIIDAAEIMIRSNLACTPAGAAVQLWCALWHSADISRAAQTAAAAGDVIELELLEDELDWDAKLMLAALRSLKEQEAN